MAPLSAEETLLTISSLYNWVTTPLLVPRKTQGDLVLKGVGTRCGFSVTGVTLRFICF